MTIKRGMLQNYFKLKKYTSLLLFKAKGTYI